MDYVFTNGVNGLKRSLLGTQRGSEMDKPRGGAIDFCSILKKRNLGVFLGLCISGGEKTDFRENVTIIDRALKPRELDDTEV